MGPVRCQTKPILRCWVEALEDRSTPSGAGLGGALAWNPDHADLPALVANPTWADDDPQSAFGDPAPEMGLAAPQSTMNVNQALQVLRAEMSEETRDHQLEQAQAAAANDAQLAQQLDQEYHEELTTLQTRIERLTQAPDSFNLDDRAFIKNLVEDRLDEAGVQPQPVNPSEPRPDDTSAAPGARASLPMDALPQPQVIPSPRSLLAPPVPATSAPDGASQEATAPAPTNPGDPAPRTIHVNNLEETEIDRPTEVVAAAWPIAEVAALQGIGPEAGSLSINTELLDAALQQFLSGADEIARSLTRTLAAPSVMPWLLAGVVVAGTGLELRRRRKHASRAVFAAVSLTMDSTLSWVPGMPGSYGDEDA